MTPRWQAPDIVLAVALIVLAAWCMWGCSPRSSFDCNQDSDNDPGYFCKWDHR
jgi:hypothetical protein